MIEYERRYLLKAIPEGLEKCDFKEMVDLYIPASFEHPYIRIRKHGDDYMITKKNPSKENPTHMQEQTIEITKEEFNALRNIPAKVLSKRRYFYDYSDIQAHIDIYQENLQGLAMCDFEFPSDEQYQKFAMPDFCLAEIIAGPNQFAAAGKLAGKTYAEIEPRLNEQSYKKINFIS